MKVAENPSAITICFAVMMAIVIIISGFVTKEVFSNGVLFKENEIEFIGLDDDNIFAYSDIEKIEFHKDEKASFKKNFNDRHSVLILPSSMPRAYATANSATLRGSSPNERLPIAFFIPC